ncbi:hypothetical protein EYC84_011029 [Monilinia fructicola]|uniref:Uncharacterized protein n=1 Tax=Monilinia fructicola TaxID=38448 RepID=A0A5M9J925_MONFR|nr:hypothetical protein EYC84_011029 [Monilinia fructicola]
MIVKSLPTIFMYYGYMHLSCTKYSIARLTLSSPYFSPASLVSCLSSNYMMTETAVAAVSLSASVIGFIPLAGQILKGCQFVCDRLDDTKGAPK